MVWRALSIFAAVTVAAFSQAERPPAVDALSAGANQTGSLTADAIMAKMAERMASAMAERRQYLYTQQVQARLVRTNGHLARLEKRTYAAIPGPERTEKQLLSVAGEDYRKKNQLVTYDKAGYTHEGMDIDGGLIQNLIEDLVDNKKSRDGVPHKLFPFAAKDLPLYDFQLLGTITHQGRQAYRVGFVPKKKPVCIWEDEDKKEEKEEDCERALWKGEAVVDAEEFQPVHIFTDLNFKMPWGVKVFLGTNLQQTGFSITYARVAPGVWFPSGYGAEFRLDLLFGYKRKISLNCHSTDFRRTEVSSEIKFVDPETNGAEGTKVPAAPPLPVQHPSVAPLAAAPAKVNPAQQNQ